MAQAKKSNARKSTKKKKSAAAKKSSAKKTTAKRKSSAKRKPSKKRSQSSRRRSQDFSSKSVAELRKALSERLVEPLNLVMLTRDRIEETVEEAVSRG